MVEIIFKRKGGVVDQVMLMMFDDHRIVEPPTQGGCQGVLRITSDILPTFTYIPRLEAAGTSGERSTNRDGQCTYAGHALRQGIVDHGYLARSSHPPFSILVYIPW